MNLWHPIPFQQGLNFAFNQAVGIALPSPFNSQQSSVSFALAYGSAGVAFNGGVTASISIPGTSAPVNVAINASVTAPTGEVFLAQPSSAPN